MAEALHQAASVEQAKKSAEAQARAAALATAKAKAEAKEADVLALPWTFTQIRDGLPVGTSLRYAVEGKNAKGKNVEDTLIAQIKGTSDKEVKFVSYRQSQDKDASVKQLQTGRWTGFSPFFAVEQAEQTLVQRETIEVPAGTFDTVVVELKGFFGQHYTVWMIRDRPGVYAKVVEHASTAQEGDKTALVYALSELNLPS